MGWLGELSSSINFYLNRFFCVRLSLIFYETWCEWYEDKQLQSHRVGFEYLHKLLQKGHKTQLFYFSREALVVVESDTTVGGAVA